MGEVVQLFTQPPVIPVSMAEAIHAVRHLDRIVIERVLAAASIPGSEAHTALSPLGGANALRMTLASQKGTWKRYRHAWRLLAIILGRDPADRDFVSAWQENTYLEAVLRSAHKRQRWNNAIVFPLLDDEAEEIGRALVDIRAAQVIKEASLKAQLELRAEEARIEKLRKQESMRVEVAALVEAIMSRTGKARFKVAIRAGNSRDDIERRAFKSLGNEVCAQARQWEAEQKAVLLERRVLAAERARLRREEQVLNTAIPESRYLVIERDDEGILVKFEPTIELSLGSKARGEAAVHVVGSRMSKARPVSSGTKGMVFTARFAMASMANLCRAISDVHAQLDAMETEALTPRMVEEALGITTTERMRWIADGRLATDGKGSFSKWGRTIEFWVHPPSIVRALQAEPDTIAGWRRTDVEASRGRRASGAARAAKTRKTNETARRQARLSVDKTAREIALAVKSPLAVPVVRLAILTTMCSRWAKLYEEKGDRSGKQVFYALKDRALRVLSVQPWACVRYVSAHTPRIDVEFCTQHLNEFRADRRTYECSALEWAQDNQQELRKCQRCDYSEDHEYYALYDISLVMGEARFSWHIPYTLGMGWLPDKDGVEHLTRSLDTDGGFYRYGRPVERDEMVAWPALKLMREVEAAIALFGAGDV